MRSFIIFLIIAALIGGGVYWVSQQKFELGMIKGDTDEVIRGDLVIPITASGSIEPASITNIKSEASGEVVKLPYDLGEMVKKGSLIVELNEEDEQRTVQRAQADVERAKIALEKANLAVQEKRDVMIPLTQAELEQAQAVAALTQARYEHTLELESRARHPLELVEHENRNKEAQAAVKAAQSKHQQAKIALALSKEDVKSAQETLNSALNTLADAKERLSETKIHAPSDGMVLVRGIQIGEVVLSGTKSLTGGTLLMQLADVSRIYAVVNVDEADIGRVRELAPPEARPGYNYASASSESNTRLASATESAEGETAATRPAEGDSEVETFDYDQEELVEITVESFENEKFYGEIEKISPQSELVRAIATFKVWIRITSDNRDKLVGLLNTQAEARFTVRAVNDAILVNWEAMKSGGDGEHGVYVPVTDPETGEEVPEFRSVKFGASDGIHVEVVEGLEVGERVYIELPVKTAKQMREEREAKD